MTQFEHVIVAAILNITFMFLFFRKSMFNEKDLKRWKKFLKKF